MSVTSRTTKSLLPLSETSARLRLEGADGENWGAGWSAWHWPVRALDAVVGAGYVEGAGNAVTTGVERLADAVDGEFAVP
jgi:hypothetical protein